MVHNFYQTLRVQRSASTEEITDAYKQLAQQYYRTKEHWVGASVAFRKAAEAYEVLVDPQKREIFDGFWDWEEGRLLRGQGRFPYVYDGDGMETYEKVFGRQDRSQFGNPPATGMIAPNLGNPVQNGQNNGWNQNQPIIQNVQHANNAQNVQNQIFVGNVQNNNDSDAIIGLIIIFVVGCFLGFLIVKFGFINVLLICALLGLVLSLLL